jgi:hypothetical protein
MESDYLMQRWVYFSLGTDCTFYDSYYRHEVRLSALLTKFCDGESSCHHKSDSRDGRCTRSAAHPRSARFIGEQKSVLECRCSIAAADSSKRRRSNRLTDCCRQGEQPPARFNLAPIPFPFSHPFMTHIHLTRAANTAWRACGAQGDRQQFKSNIYNI